MMTREGDEEDEEPHCKRFRHIDVHRLGNLNAAHFNFTYSILTPSCLFTLLQGHC